MISLEQALADQGNLGRLCSPRPLRIRERYWPNSNYGFSSVLKTYAQAPADEPLWGLIPHGVYLDGDHLFEGEIEAPVPAVFSFPAYRDEVWAKRTDKLVIGSAAPFVYAVELMRSAGWAMPERRSGTIVFPMHSTATIETNTRWSRLADELVALPDEFQPVTVCLHWQDLARKREAEFARRGMRVVSAGHLTDQEFLFRMIHLMSQHRYAASNAVASNLFYAVWLGMPYFLVGRQPELSLTRGNEHLRSQYNLGSDAAALRTEAVRGQFASLPDGSQLEPTGEQLRIASEYLGVDRLRTPEGLRDDLELARRAGHA